MLSLLLFFKLKWSYDILFKENKREILFITRSLSQRVFYL